jgi:putative SOS response-associated peptidase YedK
MCNDYANHIPWADFVHVFGGIGLPVVAPTAAPNLEPREDIRPTDRAPVIRRFGEGVELAQLRWGFPPGRPKAGPIINYRSEGRRFQNRRCLVPANAFYEFTGSKYPKAKWRFTLAGAEWFCFAGLWRPAADDVGESFTLLTTEPGPDVAGIHDRQMVVLRPNDWRAWLDLTKPEAELLRPLPAGSLAIEQIR